MGIPAETHECRLSGESPMEWAMDGNKHLILWADGPFRMIRYLRKLIYVSTGSLQIVRILPPAAAIAAGGDCFVGV